MLGWRKHKLESRLLGEISITSDMQICRYADIQTERLNWTELHLFCFVVSMDLREKYNVVDERRKRNILEHFPRCFSVNPSSPSSALLFYFYMDALRWPWRSRFPHYVIRTGYFLLFVHFCMIKPFWRRLLFHFSSVAQSCPTLCDPMDHSMPGLPVHHQLPEFTQTHVHRVGDAIQPSHPLSSPSPLATNH